MLYIQHTQCAGNSKKSAIRKNCREPVFLPFLTSVLWGNCPVLGVRVARVRGDGTAVPAVAPLALTAHVVASGVDQSGTPGLVVGQMSLVPGTGVMGHPVEAEGKDARLVGRGAAGGDADFFGCKQEEER